MASCHGRYKQAGLASHSESVASEPTIQGFLAYLDPRDRHAIAPSLQAWRSLRIVMASFFQNILVVFPPFSNPETARPTRAQAGSYPTTGGAGGAEDPIYFYDSDKPYFESAKLSLAILFSLLMLGCLTPRRQVYKLLRPCRRISRAHLSNCGAPYAFCYSK
jgi:hypothetical protein